MKSIKQINIKNRLYYFFNGMTNTKNFDSNLINIDKISFKSTNTVIYNIKYITINIDSETPLYLSFNNTDGYIKESNRDKYLIFASTDKNKKVLEKYTELWNEIKNQNEIINGGEPIKYKKDFMKIRCESDGGLPLGKISSNCGIIIVYINVCMNL